MVRERPHACANLNGVWHLIGITHKQLDIPPLERFFTAERSISTDEVNALHRALRESAASAKREGRRWFDAHDERQLAHAVAPSLTTTQWRKEPFALVADASESVLWAPHIVTHDSLHYMFYAAGSAHGDGRFRMHLATSPNLHTWARFPTNPLFVDGFEALIRWCYASTDAGSCTTRQPNPRPADITSWRIG